MAQLNSQVGKALTQQLAPELDGYEVVDETWKPKDLLQHDDTKGRKSTVINTTFYAPGTEVDCELVQYLTDPVVAELKKSNVIDEKTTDTNPNPGKWLVLKADPIRFGGRSQHYSVTLRRNADQNLGSVIAA